MKIKLDENLPSQLVRFLSQLGNEADTVPDEGLAGQDDPFIWDEAQKARRFLMWNSGNNALLWLQSIKSASVILQNDVRSCLKKYKNSLPQAKSSLNFTGRK